MSSIDQLDRDQDRDEILAERRARLLGYVFQAYQLVPELTALENVTLAARIAGRSGAAVEREARDLLDRVGLAQRLTHLPGKLSGGECQRAAIARALAPDPALILADEPTGNLDSHNGSEILAIFDGLHRQGKTLMVITHDTALAGRIPRSVRMADGRVLEVPSP